MEESKTIIKQAVKAVYCDIIDAQILILLNVILINENINKHSVKKIFRKNKFINKDDQQSCIHFCNCALYTQCTSGETGNTSHFLNMHNTIIVNMKLTDRKNTMETTSKTQNCSWKSISH